MYGDHMRCEQTRSSLADVTLDSTFGLNPDHDKIERELLPHPAQVLYVRERITGPFPSTSPLRVTTVSCVYGYG